MRESYLVPTYLTFFGLVNIQKRANGTHISTEEVKEIWKRLGLFLPFNAIFETDPHTFGSADNFIRNGRTIQMVDYGFLGNRERISVSKFLKKHQKELIKVFTASKF